MHMPIGNPTVELRTISLAVEDPGDEYLGDIPVVDEFGQWNLGDFKGKARSLDQLNAEWAYDSAASRIMIFSVFAGMSLMCSALTVMTNLLRKRIWTGSRG
jgi:hypothetical protein